MCCARCASSGYDVAHRVDDRLHDVTSVGSRAAEQPRVAHRATQDAAQHVAASFVRREHAVGEQERDRARVIGEHAERRRIDRVRHDVDRPSRCARPCAARRSRGPSTSMPTVFSTAAISGANTSVWIVVRHALHDRRDALEPRARVDRRLGQRNERAVRLPVELHEHEIPDLEEPARLRALDERVVRELLAIELGPLARRARRESASRVAMCARSTKISEHGPHGPVSAICQKLSLSPSP